MAAPAPTGAMALLEKYSTLASNIESTRHAIAEVQNSTEEARQDVSNLLQVRETMTNQLDDAKTEQSDLRQKLKETRSKRQTLNERLDRARRELDEAKREDVRARNCVEDARVAFLQRRKDFRRACSDARFRLVGDAEAAATGGTASYGAVLGDGKNDGGRGVSTDENDGRSGGNYRFGTIQALRLSDDDRYDGSSNIASIDDISQFLVTDDNENSSYNRRTMDEETNRALASYRSAQSERLYMESALSSVREKHADAQLRARSRQTKLGQQRTQLERVRSEVLQMERELRKLEQDAAECRELGDSLAMTADRRKRGASTGGGDGVGGSNGNQYSLRHPPPQHQHQHQHRRNNASSFHRNFNLPPEITDAQIDIEVHDYRSGVDRSDRASRQTTISPLEMSSQQNPQLQRRNGGGYSNPYSRPSAGSGSERSGYAARQQARLTNPYANTSSEGDKMTKKRSDDRPVISSRDYQHPHRSGRSRRSNRRFNTALEIFADDDGQNDVQSDDIDGPDRAAGGLSSSRTPLRAIRRESDAERMRKLLDDDDDDDDELLNMTIFNRK